MARGTDIHPLYQRGIRWDQVQDIHFVWVKVSDGGAPYSTTSGGIKYVPDTHVAGAKSRGFPVGGYHYAQLNPGPDAQADVLLAAIRRLGATGVTPMLDLEAPFNPDATAKAFGIAFCKRIAAGGFRPAVYMNSSFARALRPDQWGIPGLVIVVARYGAKPEAPGSAQYTGRYDVHQYSSGGGLPGSTGAVDLDESFTDTLLDPIHSGGDDDMDKNQDQLLRELHVELTGAAAPIYPPEKYIPIRALVLAQGAKLDALAQAVAAATNDPDITLDQMRDLVNDAVRQNIEITGDLHIGPAVAAELAEPPQ